MATSPILGPVRASSHSLSHVCAELRNFVKDFFSPEVTGNFKQASLAHYSRSPSPHTHHLPPHPHLQILHFHFPIFFSVQLAFVPCTLKSTFLEWKCCWKKVGGYELQGPGLSPLTALPVKCHLSGAPRDKLSKYFPRRCLVFSFLTKTANH